MKNPATLHVHRSEIGLIGRFCLVVGAWATALIAAAIGLEPGAYLDEQALLFPLGWLLAVPFMRIPDGDRGLEKLAVIGWVAYLALTALVLFTRRRKVYFLVYSVLVLLLAFNAWGCHDLRHLNLKQ